tara:strand:- start:345 stop:1625 length:1281 start_codon:yes stop_codon:yes gene_type:complete
MSKPDTPDNDDLIEDTESLDDAVTDESWDDDLSDEDWDDDSFLDEDSASELSAPPKKSDKKKSILFPLLVLLILAAITGGGAFWYIQQMQNEGNLPPVVQNVMPEQDKGNIDPVSNVEKQADNNDPFAQQNQNSEQDGPTPSTQNTKATPVTKHETVESNILTPMPAPDLIANTELAQLDAFENEQSQEIEMPIDQSEGTSEDESNLAQSLDPFVTPFSAESDSNSETTEKSPEMLEEDVMLQKTEIEHNIAAKALDNAQNQTTSLEDTLSTEMPTKIIESSPEPVMGLDKDIKDQEVEMPITASKNPKQVAKSEQKPAPQKEKKEPKTVEPVKKAEKPAPAQAPAQKEKSKPEEKSTVVKKYTYKASDWVLRSAQTGRAVIYNKRSGETKSVEVGYFVSGLGKIESISKVSGKWIVKGTMGSVTQ